MKSTAVLAAVAGVAATAATSFGQFSGAYAPANWTFNANGGDGSVNTGGAPASIDLTGNNNLSAGINTDYTITVAGAGSVTFNWLYNTPDTGTYDAAYYLLNGNQVFLSDNNTPGAGGSVSFPVSAGNTIGFRVWSADGGFGAGTLTISNFGAPVPAPGTLALAGMGGLLAARRRRR